MTFLFSSYWKKWIILCQLGVNQGSASKSMEKLSSGMRINRAGDDAAGLAISEKMRGQIRGLKQASRNAQDGISLIQTAEGALNETHAILQRMRELADQASTDTNTREDRLEIQKEVTQLTREIDRIARTTQFNTMELLNGKYENMYFHIGANMDQNLAVDIADMRADALGLIGTEPVEETEAGEVVTVAQVETTSADVSGVTIAEDSSYEGTFTLSIEHDGTSEVNATLKNDASDVIASSNDISAGEITIGDFTLNVDTLPTETDGSENFDVILEVTQVDPATLEEAEVPSLENTVSGTDVDKVKNVVVDVESGYGGEYKVENDGTNITIIGPDGQTVGQEAVTAITDNAITIEGFTITFDGTPAANDEFTITVTPAEVPEEGEVDESTMHGINVDTREAANEALSTIDEAISMVSEERSKLGAMQNRLEHTIANLGTSAENLQAAESRIRDLDMAEEIMAFTKNNILQQAATAMLAQANMAPQSVLQLLG